MNWGIVAIIVGFAGLVALSAWGIMAVWNTVMVPPMGYMPYWAAAILTAMFGLGIKGSGKS